MALCNRVFYSYGNWDGNQMSSVVINVITGTEIGTFFFGGTERGRCFDFGTPRMNKMTRVKVVYDELFGPSYTIPVYEVGSEMMTGKQVMDRISRSYWVFGDDKPAYKVCEYTHAHTRHWCGNAGCRES